MSGAANVVGQWQLDIRTPLGTQTPIVTLEATADGLIGHADDRHGRTALRDITYLDAHLTWSQSVTRAMNLDLSFYLHVEGDVLDGTAKAGRLPKSRVTGRRIDSPDGDS